MSIYYSGSFTRRSGGVISSIVKQLNLVNLKPVKQIQVQFDPFTKNARTARDFLWHISNARVLETNLNCRIRTNVVCDRSETQIKVDLGDKGNIKFLADNLTVLEILQLLNKFILPLIKAEEAPTNILTAKIQQKVQKRR